MIGLASLRCHGEPHGPQTVCALCSCWASGDVFEAKPGYAEFFVRAKLAERVTDEDAAEVPVTKAKRKYTKRALTATDYETVDLRAA